MTTVRLLPVVAAALLDAEGRVLLQRRRAGGHHAGLWEFPGGKVEPGESPEAALVRELHEELAIEIDPGQLDPVSFASEAQGERHLLLLLYLVRRWRGVPTMAATAADAVRWVTPAEMATIAMPPADVPLVAALRARLARSMPWTPTIPN